MNDRENTRDRDKMPTTERPKTERGEIENQEIDDDAMDEEETRSDLGAGE